MNVFLTILKNYKIGKMSLLKYVLLVFFRYTENAKIASERFKDRPMTPAQTVDYWTSYVIRHKGAPHLKSHALNLAWYQYYSLDVISVLSLVVGLAVYITIFITRSIYKPYTINIKFKSE